MATTEFERWLGNYQPNSLTGAQWERVRPFVLEQMLLLPRDRQRVERMRALNLARLAVWSAGHGTPLTVAAVVDEDNVELYLTSIEGTCDSTGDLRSLYRAMGRVLNPTGWRPKPRKRKHRYLAPPYTPAEARLLRAAPQIQKTRLRRRAALVIISLGFGAGVDGGPNVLVEPDDVTADPRGVLVAVRGQAPRTVVVSREWEDTVARLADEARAEGWPLLVGARRKDPNRSNTLARKIIVPTGAPGVQASRLRTTWMVAQLNAGTNVRVLLEAAGANSQSLVDLVWNLDPVAADEARRQLREGVAR